MWSEFWVSILGVFGGAVILVPALMWLSDRFLGQGLAKDLKRFETQLERVSDLVSRRNEREFAVVEVAWEHMIHAVAEVENRLTSARLNIPTFAVLGDEELDRVIGMLPFSELERNSVREAPKAERGAICAIYETTLAYRECSKAWGELKNWLSTHEIFMSSDIHRRFRSIENHVTHALSIVFTSAVAKEALPTAQRIEIGQLFGATVSTEKRELGGAIRKRFGFYE
ncbi:MAG: hypothetical protein ABI779_19835 [Acidobacteriota bacterium]